MLAACLPVAADLVFAVSFSSYVRANTMRANVRQCITVSRARMCVCVCARACAREHELECVPAHNSFRCRHPLCRRRRRRSLRFCYFSSLFRLSCALAFFCLLFSVFYFNLSLSDCDRIHSLTLTRKQRPFTRSIAISFARIRPFQLNLLFCFILFKTHTHTHARRACCCRCFPPYTLFNQQLVRKQCINFTNESVLCKLYSAAAV